MANKSQNVLLQGLIYISRYLMKPVTAKRQQGDGVRRLLEGVHHDPFEVLGAHSEEGTWVIRALLPATAEAEVLLPTGSEPMERLPGTDLFSVRLESVAAPDYRLRWRPGHGDWREEEDPYRFGPVVGDLDLHRFGEGRHEHV